MSGATNANLNPLMMCWVAEELQIATTVSAVSKTLPLQLVGIARLRPWVSVSMSMLASGEYAEVALLDFVMSFFVSKWCTRKSDSWQAFAQRFCTPSYHVWMGR